MILFRIFVFAFTYFIYDAILFSIFSEGKSGWNPEYKVAQERAMVWGILMAFLTALII